MIKIEYFFECDGIIGFPEIFQTLGFMRSIDDLIGITNLLPEILDYEILSIFSNHSAFQRLLNFQFSKMHRSSHTNNTALKLLDSIQSAALRLAFGALHTSPTLSLCAQAGVPPLQFRFLSLTANFLASTAQFPQIPIFVPSLCPQNSLRLSLGAPLGKHLTLEPLPPIYSSFPPWKLALPVI